MPPAAKRNGSVILYDVNTKPEFAVAAKKCLLNICGAKFFSESQDTTKLMLINTEKTNNPLHSKFGKCPHVYEATDAVVYDPKLILPHIEDVKTAEADWLVGLAAALEAIRENFLEVKGIMNLQLVFITDFSTPVKSKESRIEFIINNVKKMNVRLYIFGPSVKFPHHMSMIKDVRLWSENIQFISDEAENPNLLIVKRIIQETNGVICDLELGQELFECYTDQWSLQPWKVPLTIGTSLAVPSSTIRFLKEDGGPTFKADELEGFGQEWKWHPVDDALEEVPYENVIGGIFKHGKFVPLPDDVERDFKYKGPRGFKIVGFTDQRNVSEMDLIGDASYFVESDNSVAFKLLVDVLAEQKKCIIAQRIYMANCKPKLEVLLPDPEREILIMAEVPYSDVIQLNYTEKNISEAPKLEKDTPAVKEMYEYLQKLDITDTNNRDENGSVKVPLAAPLMNSMQLNLVRQQCVQKYLDQENSIDEVGIKLPELTEYDTYKGIIIPRPKEEPIKQSDD